MKLVRGVRGPKDGSSSLDELDFAAPGVVPLSGFRPKAKVVTSTTINATPPSPDKTGTQNNVRRAGVRRRASCTTTRFFVAALRFPRAAKTTGDSGGASGTGGGAVTRGHSISS